MLNASHTICSIYYIISILIRIEQSLPSEQNCAHTTSILEQTHKTLFYPEDGVVIQPTGLPACLHLFTLYVHMSYSSLSPEYTCWGKIINSHPICLFGTVHSFADLQSHIVFPSDRPNSPPFQNCAWCEKNVIKSTLPSSIFHALIKKHIFENPPFPNLTTIPLTEVARSASTSHFIYTCSLPILSIHVHYGTCVNF